MEYATNWPFTEMELINDLGSGAIPNTRVVCLERMYLFPSPQHEMTEQA